MEKIKVGFFYPKYYPVSGGMSVHGYNLVRGLTNNKVEIHTLGMNDGISISYSKNVFNFLKMFFGTDLIYCRVGTGGGILNKIPFISKVFRKKLIVELNGPSDEILQKGGTKKDVLYRDKVLIKRLKYSDAIIVVSEAVKEYVVKILKINHIPITVIPNGGEPYCSKGIKPSNKIEEKVQPFLNRYPKIVFWSGTAEPWQGYTTIQKIIENSPSDIGYVLVCNQKLEGIINEENVLVLEKLQRHEILYVLNQCDIGLALYGDFNWSRIGFFNSSLKFFEYLANGLYTLASPKGQILSYANEPNVYLSDDSIELLAQIIDYKVVDKENIKYRSWDDVAVETIKVINNLY